ncbi:GNAT family N-acetyltransferase [Haliangium sp.]|uniref:GNAT family N-acetyltransferase n=1 Tax=Haliangium sp. TaxID=2663208 RepID=UPI003D1380AD
MSGQRVTVTDKAQIEAFLRLDVGLHVYELGDLDPFFWHHTRWHGWRVGDELRALCLLYTATDPITLLALCRADAVEPMVQLLLDLTPMLPTRVYAHLAPGLFDHLAAQWRSVVSRGRHVKMMLTDTSIIEADDAGAGWEAVAISTDDLPSVQRFYADSYPGNWFDARMLDTGQYRGMRRGDSWLAVAGVHVYSPQYRVAALGNIAVSAAHRGQGLGRAVTATVCRAMRPNIDVIGLNVHHDNAIARRCYEGLGFTTVGGYDEILLERR